MYVIPILIYLLTNLNKYLMYFFLIYIGTFSPPLATCQAAFSFTLSLHFFIKLFGYPSLCVLVCVQCHKYMLIHSPEKCTYTNSPGMGQNLKTQKGVINTVTKVIIKETRDRR